MIEQIIREHIGTLVSAYMEVPEQITDREYVVIEKTGGRSTEGLRTATIAVQSYAPSLYDAAVLNERVVELMGDIVGKKNIFSCTLNSNYNFTDTKTKRYRYQAIFDLVYKE